MKQDFKIGMLAGLAVLVVVAVGWALLRGRPAPQTVSGGVRTPTMGIQEPNRPLGVPAPGLQPYATGAGTTGAMQPVSPAPRQEPNGVAGQPLAGTVGAAAVKPVQAAASNTQTQPAETAKPARTHTVQEGESLSDLSDKYYGSSDKWAKIYKANRSTIKDPDRIYPGMKLVIPE